MRLIDANKLLNKSIIVENVNSTGRTKIMVDRNDIDNAPTVDAEPVVHGHWIWNEDSHRYECSVCHGECATSFTENPLFKPFCGECGAKMDEEAEQE